MFMWVVIRPTGDLPPIVESMTTLNHTTSQAARTVQVTGIDCNAANPADTGIASVTLHYRVGGGSYTDVAMTATNFVWSGDIPAGLALDSTIGYYVTATDIHSNSVNYPSGPRSYRIVQFSRDGYSTTFPTYSFVDITSTGTPIPSADFFPGGNFDDGTAGPFSLGGTFRYFGQDVTHAWVGANGALGLSSSATDTINVNAGGFYSPFTIPQAGVPKNFVSAFWNDLWLGPDGHGTVYYEVQGSQFIVEFYKVGNFNSATDTTTTFEFILDRGDSSITLQYADVGNTGLELTALVGLQDSNSTGGWVFLNRFGYPTESQPAANLAIKMKRVVTGVRPVDGVMPARYALYANYPNPFNPTTKISYDIPNRSRVELAIYNLLGEKVADLVSDVQDAGTYSATWDGRNLQGQLVSSGVYIYRLQAGNYLDTKKMVLLK